MTKKQISREGFEKLEKQLEHLITVRRAEVAQKLKEARAFGDLSENAEYDEAKNEQGILEAQIAELENTLNNAEVVDDDKISINEVGVGSIVTVRQIGHDTIQKLQLVGSTEIDPAIGRISDESPIGKAVMKKKVGDTFIVEAPIGELEYEVLEISK
ncbi:MAG: transcription elongation factor GreA [Clostridiales bacterium]|nr:transcription elongation factor GreA [Clostridiales bacterium]